MMRKELSFFNEWTQFVFTDIYPLCMFIGALVGAYYGYEAVEKRIDPWSAVGVFIAAVFGGVAGAVVGMFIGSIPYLVIFAAVVYGVYFIGKVLYEMFGDDPLPAAKPEVKSEVKPVVKIQPPPAPAYKPKEPTAKQVDIDFVTRCLAIFGLCLLFIFISMGSDKKAPTRPESPSISQSSQSAKPETPEPTKRVVERVVVREHDDPAGVNHNKVTRLDLPAPPLGVEDIRTWNDMMAGYVDAPKPKAIAVGSNGVFYYYHGPNAAQRSLGACRDMGGISCTIFEQKD